MQDFLSKYINAQNFAVKLMGVVFTKEKLASSTVGGGMRKLPFQNVRNKACCGDRIS